MLQPLRLLTAKVTQLGSGRTREKTREPAFLPILTSKGRQLSKVA